MTGWELKKALQLAKKNNASFFEWITSPLIYIQDNSFLPQTIDIINTYYNKLGLAHHWRSLAQHNIKAYVNVHDMKYKQYLYVIRPLLCIKWLIDHDGDSAFPPPLFESLVNEVKLDDSVRTTITDLIAKKKEGSYLGEGRHFYELEKWFGWMVDKATPEYCAENKGIDKRKKTKTGGQEGDENIASVDEVLDKLFFSLVMKYGK